MNDHDMVTLQQLATVTGASVDRLRYWARLLGHQVGKHGRCRAVTTAAGQELAMAARLVASGTLPSIACHEISTARQQTTASDLVTTGDRVHQNPVEDALVAVASGQRAGFEALRDMVATLTHQVEQQRVELSALREIVGSIAVASVNQARSLARVGDALAGRVGVADLPAMLEPPRAITTWSPPGKLPDPLEGLPWWRRAWVRLVEPERLRRRDN